MIIIKYLQINQILEVDVSLTKPDARFLCSNKHIELVNDSTLLSLKFIS